MVLENGSYWGKFLPYCNILLFECDALDQSYIFYDLKVRNKIFCEIVQVFFNIWYYFLYYINSQHLHLSFLMSTVVVMLTRIVVVLGLPGLSLTLGRGRIAGLRYHARHVWHDGPRDWHCPRSARVWWLCRLVGCWQQQTRWLGSQQEVWLLARLWA